MPKFYYDFHVHTALSPCADDDMTPSNIVGMANLIGLDMIAVTDHNSILNAKSVILAAEKEGSLLVLPGMELETEEAIHVLMLFPSLLDAEKAYDVVEKNCLNIANKSHIYGRQIVFDASDHEIGEEKRLLVSSTFLSLNDTIALANECNGVAIPAHIDKPSNSIMAILGAITPEMGFKTVEVSAIASQARIEQLQKEGYLVLFDSDSHMLGGLNEKERNFLELEKFSASEVIKALRNIK